MRNLSLTLRQAMHAEATGEVIVFLVTISHDDWAEPLRLSSDPTERFSVDPLVYGTTSRGEQYAFVPMWLTLPVEAEDAAPTMRLGLENVTRQAMPRLRSIRSPAKLTTEMVLASAPDTVEATWPDFDVVAAPYDAERVTLNLALNVLSSEPFPAGTYTPAQFPGLF